MKPARGPRAATRQKMRPEECPFFRSPIWPTARVLRGFQKAGGPPFLDMRPSDVGRRLSLHVQSPPPIALNTKFPATPRRFLRLKTLRPIPGSVSFQESCFANLPAARTMSARCFDADPDLAKQNAPRSNAPASPARQMCSDPNRILLSASRTNSGSLVSMASIRQKVRMFFLPPSSRPTSTMFINKGLLCEARVNCQARYRKDFFAVIALFREGCKICMPAS